VTSKRRLPEQMLGEIHQRSVACRDQLFDCKTKCVVAASGLPARSIRDCCRG
jgi:hypothetical protein